MLAKILAAAVQSNPDDALSTISTVLAQHGIRSLLVTVDDQHVEPYVASTIGKTDITVPMVQGAVYVLLEQAGVKNPAPQANLAAKFISGYVQKNL